MRSSSSSSGPRAPGAAAGNRSQYAQRWLPYETTQGSAPGQQVSVGGGLWVKTLTPDLWPAERGRGLRFVGSTEGELLTSTMTADPVQVSVGATLGDAVEAMKGRKISELPVVDRGGRLVGLIDLTDLIGLVPTETEE